MIRKKIRGYSFFLEWSKKIFLFFVTKNIYSWFVCARLKSSETTRIRKDTFTVLILISLWNQVTTDWLGAPVWFFFSSGTLSQSNTLVYYSESVIQYGWESNRMDGMVVMAECIFCLYALSSFLRFLGTTYQKRI